MSSLREIELHKIKKSPHNPRYTFDKIALEELAETIRSVVGWEGNFL